MEKNDLPLYDWSDKCILIVDDVKINFTLISVLLKSTNTKLMWASNGKEAIDIFNSNPEIDLVLMDIRMPVMDGYEATAIIKKYNKDIPVIAQTAYALVEDKNKCLKAGCDDFLEKPILKDVLFTKINNFFSKKK